MSDEQLAEISVHQLRAGDVVDYRNPTTDVVWRAGVLRLLHGKGGGLIGFFPTASLGVDPSVAIETQRIVRAWRPLSERKDR